MENSELKKLHSIELIIADELKRICDKHSIKYFMIAGTLLGAVRHKGFIPWDDDMDFGMARVDFDKFMSIAPVEINTDLFYLQSETSDRYYPFNFTKIRLNGTSIIEEFDEKNNNRNRGIFIDVFPIDNVWENQTIRRIKYIMFKSYRALLLKKCGYGTDEMKKTIKYRFKKFISCFYTIEQLKKKKSKIITKLKNERTTNVVVSDGTYGPEKETIKAEWINKIHDYQFEDRVFPGIADSHSYLTRLYGDYMKLPPKEKRNHHGVIRIDYGPYSEQCE